MRWIYLSPHLDDAVLSAGGLIYEQAQSGIPVEIWTLMAGYVPPGPLSPFAELQHKQWGFASAEETTRSRRQEDEAAAAVVGASVVHFDFLDCIYRRGVTGEWLYNDIYLPPHSQEARLPAQIAEALSARLRPDDVLVCQLAVGSHVDHVLVRQGAELLGYPLRYDIDVPYIFYKPEEVGPKSAGMKESVYLVTDMGLNRWKEAALAYKSQIVGLGAAFNTPEKVRESIQAYWAEQGGVRLLQVD